MRTFILYDDARPNADGTRVRLEGLQLSRFKKNPVMLYMHNRAEPQGHKPDGSEVIGRWEHIRIQGSQLLADAVFDEKDNLAKKIARKVKEGFLKGASIGIDVHRTSDAKADKVQGQGSSTITESTLLEASIVDIPQNEDALNHCALYQSFAIGSASVEKKPSETFFRAVKQACHIKEDLNEEALLVELQKYAQAYEQLQEWKKSFLGAQAQQLLQQAEAEGLISQEEQASYRACFMKDFEATRAQLHTLREKVQEKANKQGALAAFLAKIRAPIPQDTATTVSASAPGDSVYHQLLKHEPERLKTLQQQNPSAFRQLLEAHLSWKYRSTHKSYAKKAAAAPSACPSEATDSAC